MKLYGKFDGEAITEISYNLKAFEEYDDIYYTTKEASPYNYSNGDIDAEDITELVTEDEFLEKFKKWYLSD